MGKDSGLKVVSTIGMINDIVKEVGGTHVNAQGLCGPGVDPHLYKASAGDVKLLSKADVIFYNGLHLEAKMAEILEKMSSNKLTIAVTDGVPKSELDAPPEFEGYYDPHLWFDVSLWTYTVKAIADGLIEADPANAEDYQKNAQAYLDRLQTLHQWIQTEVQAIPKSKRILVTAHDAFGYFAKAYDFEVYGLQGISTASEAGIKYIQAITDLIIEKQVPTIFIESSVPVRHIQAVQAAVRAKNWDVEIGEELFTDAMGDEGTPEGTYIGMIQHNIHSIVNGLTRKN